ncbi:DUF2269 family protein [Pseudomonas sp.]|uniref:DUF2269 family protein n=1 Tax=Pseudomonas sp. TaxID=306 RepID=UPI0028B1836A|nr:DUF2269 family protein [Pseudomonas sp.]
MEHLTTLKTLHVLAASLVLISALGLALWAWRARRLGQAETGARLLRRPLLFVWLLMLLCLASLPVSGWWLVHLIGWPLGQTWLLASSVLYLLTAFSSAWLLVRLNRLRRGIPCGVGLTLGLAVFSAAGLLASAALMGAKPV